MPNINFTEVDLMVAELVGQAREAALRDFSEVATEEPTAATAEEEREVITDSFTGDVIEGDDYIFIDFRDGFYFENSTNAERYGFRQCEHCGEWVVPSGIDPHSDAEIMPNGDWMCDDECAHAEGWYRCARCGDWVHEYDILVPNDYEPEYSYCSASCATRDGWTRCDCCENWVREDDTYRVNSSSCEERWCESCYEDESRRCEGCGEDFHYDDGRYVDDYWYCDSCANECGGGEHLHEYGYRPYPFKYHGDASKTPYLGTEIETDGGYNRGEYVDALANIDEFLDHFWMTRDSSLDNGVEITSFPMTLDYHMSIKPMYETIRDTALEHDFKSHDGGRCGLHIHVNRDYFGKSVTAQDCGGYKLMRLLQRFEQPFTMFSRRKNNRWCDYATSRKYGPTCKDRPDTMDELLSKANQMRYETCHSQALNFQHGATFEFRIFRGTLKLSTMFACFAMVNGLCHVAKTHGSIYVESVTWYDLMHDVLEACDNDEAREYLKSYLEEKELI